MIVYEFNMHNYNLHRLGDDPPLDLTRFFPLPLGSSSSSSRSLGSSPSENCSKSSLEFPDDDDESMRRRSGRARGCDGPGVGEVRGDEWQGEGTRGGEVVWREEPPAP
jgi:hypothetical protein